MLIDPRHLVTAAHVLHRLDPDTGAKVAVEQVDVEFPGRELGGQAGRAAASRLDLGAAAETECKPSRGSARRSGHSIAARQVPATGRPSSRTCARPGRVTPTSRETRPTRKPPRA